ncbi:MAG TPA: hypothetical protein VJY33_04580 [Isosphaeraceae bacterium]|nr:hypothetical protein [Isosphaeraceae bacterium]
MTFRWAALFTEAGKKNDRLVLAAGRRVRSNDDGRELPENSFWPAALASRKRETSLTLATYVPIMILDSLGLR